jgi:hypothetical protein
MFHGALAISAAAGIALTDRKGWALGCIFSELNRPARQYLCLRFAMLPRGTTGKTRGQNGVASPFLWGSFIPYNVPVYPGARSVSLKLRWRDASRSK